MNRFDKPVQYDYSFDRYMPQFTLPNFQLLAGALEGQEQKQAQFEELANKLPQYIQSGTIEDIDPITGKKVSFSYGDTESYNLLVEKNKQLQAEMEAAFQTGDMAIINQVRNKVMREVQKIHGPTGWATGLQKRYDDHIKYLESIQKRADEDADWNAVNRKYAERQYLANIGKHDPAAQNFRNVNAPLMYAYTNIEKEIQDFASKTGDQKVKIERKPDDSGWQITEGREEATPEAIASIEAFINNPRLNEQYKIERYNMFNAAGGLDKINAGMADYNKGLDLRTQLMNKAKDLLAKPNKTKAEEEQLTEAYLMLGFAKPEMKDGVRVINTVQAEQTLRDAPSDYFELKKINDPVGFAQKQLENRYMLSGKGALDVGYEYTLTRDPYWVAYQKRSWDIELEDYKQSFTNQPQFGTFSSGDVNTDPIETVNSLQQAQQNLDDLQQGYQTNLGLYFINSKLNPTEQMNDILKNSSMIMRKAGQIASIFKPGMTVAQLGQELIRIGIPEQNVRNGNIQKLHDDLTSNDFQRQYQGLQNAQVEANNKRAEAEQIVFDNDGLFKDLDLGFSYKLFDPNNESYVTKRSAQGGGSATVGDYKYKNAMKYNVGKEEYIISKGEADWLFSKPYNELTPYQKQHRDAITVTIAKTPEAQKVPAQKSLVTVFGKGNTADVLNLLQTHLNVSRDVLSQIPQQEIYTKQGVNILDPKDIKVTVGGLGIGDNGLPVVELKLSRAKEGGEPLQQGATVKIPLSSLTTEEFGDRAIKDAFFDDAITNTGEWRATETDKYNAGQIAFYYETGSSLTLQNAAVQQMRREKNNTEKPIKEFSATKDNQKFSWIIYGIKDAQGRISFDVRKIEGNKPVSVKNGKFQNIQDAQSWVGYLLTQPNWIETVRIKPETDTRKVKIND